MPGLFEASEFTMKACRRFFVRLMCCFWRSETAQVNLLSFNGYFASPSLSRLVPVNSFESTVVARLFSSVATVLRPCRYPKIASSIVKGISVSMIRQHSIWRPYDIGRHRNGYSLTRRVAECSSRVKGLCQRAPECLPFVFRETIKVFFVDDCKLALRERYAIDFWCGLRVQCKLVHEAALLQAVSTSASILSLSDASEVFSG